MYEDVIEYSGLVTSLPERVAPQFGPTGTRRTPVYEPNARGVSDSVLLRGGYDTRIASMRSKAALKEVPEQMRCYTTHRILVVPPDHLESVPSRLRSREASIVGEPSFLGFTSIDCDGNVVETEVDDGSHGFYRPDGHSSSRSFHLACIRLQNFRACTPGETRATYSRVIRRLAQTETGGVKRLTVTRELTMTCWHLRNILLPLFWEYVEGCNMLGHRPSRHDHAGSDQIVPLQNGLYAQGLHNPTICAYVQ